MGIGDQPAFPTPPTQDWEGYKGISYRQWLIGMCAQGFCVNSYGSSPVTDVSRETGIPTREIIAQCAIEQADAILAALEKEQS